ncbi:MAG TPA: hypothetical protein VKA90_01960 [Beijerinckiaceae bacterium]|nr:hypothetical protein [Beijerinckiaceae bacterium]
MICRSSASIIASDRHLLAGGLRQRLRLKPRAPVADQQRAALRASVVIEHRLDPLLPLRALLTERVPQPDPSTQIQDVIGRNPGLRQPPDHQQLAQMPDVRPIVLRALLRTPQPGRLRRLGQMHHRTRQLVVASSATSSSRPRKRSMNRRTPARSAGATRARLTSPVSGSNHSAVICARC